MMSNMNANGANHISNQRNGEGLNGPIMEQENSVKAMNVATAAFANSAINTALTQQQAKARQTYTNLQRQQEQQFAMIQQQQRRQSQPQQILSQKIDASMSAMNGKTSIDPMIYQQLFAKSQQQKLSGMAMVPNPQEVNSPSIESFQSQIKKQAFQQKHPQQGQHQTHIQPTTVITSQNAMINTQQQSQPLGSPIVAVPISPHVMNNTFMQQQLAYIQTKQHDITNMTNNQVANAIFNTSSNKIGNNSNNSGNENIKENGGTGESNRSKIEDNNNNNINGIKDKISQNKSGNNSVNNTSNGTIYNSIVNKHADNSNNDHGIGVTTIDLNNIGNNRNNKQDINGGKLKRESNNANNFGAATAVNLGTQNGFVVTNINGNKQPMTPATLQFNVGSPQNSQAVNQAAISNHFKQKQQHVVTPVIHPSKIPVNGNNIAEGSAGSIISNSGSPIIMASGNHQTTQFVPGNNNMDNMQQKYQVVKDELKNANMPSSTHQSQIKNIRNLKLNMTRQQQPNSNLLAFRKQFSRVAKLRLFEFCNDISSVRIPTQQPINFQAHQQSQIQSTIRNNSYALKVWQSLVNKYFDDTSNSCLRYSQLVSHKTKLLKIKNNGDNKADSLNSSSFYEFSYPLIAHFFNSLLGDGVYKLELNLNNINTKFLPTVLTNSSQQIMNAFNYNEIFLESSGEINFLFADGSSISSKVLFRGKLVIMNSSNVKQDKFYDASIFDNDNNLKFNMVDLQVINFFSRMNTQSLDRFFTSNTNIPMNNNKLVFQQNFKALRATSPLGLQPTCVRNLQILDIMSVLRPLMEFQSASSINVVDQALGAYIHESLKINGSKLAQNSGEKSNENGNLGGGSIRPEIQGANGSADSNNNLKIPNSITFNANTNDNGIRERININSEPSLLANGSVSNMPRNTVVSSVKRNQQNTKSFTPESIPFKKIDNSNRSNADKVNNNINNRNKRKPDIAVSPKTKLQRLKE